MISIVALVLAAGATSLAKAPLDTEATIVATSTVADSEGWNTPHVYCRNAVFPLRGHGVFEHRSASCFATALI